MSFIFGLLPLWALFLFGGYVWGQPDPYRRMPTWTRMASSVVLVVASWAWVMAKGGTYSWLIALGMSCGFLGDLFMAGVIGSKKSVVGGMASFGVGHLFYIAAILGMDGVSTAVRLTAWSIWLIIGAVGWYFVVYRGQTATLLHKLALPYALLLASTAGMATGLAWAEPRFSTLAMGATLFLISDLIIAADLFNEVRFPQIGDWIWFTYGPAQALIVYSVIWV